MIVADLHIHSRFSRATARNLDPEHLWVAAQQKGLDLLGSGDFTHPQWSAELREKLVETGDGAYELAPALAAVLAPEVPPACRRPVRFVLSGEISCIYKRHGQTRKVHSLILLPDFAALERFNQRLGRLGNLVSDGRPILGLDARDLLELTLDASPEAVFIPAHIWTPWFSLFGSKSGFDTLEECFGDLAGEVHALETGLSSDPAMNWRLSALDRFVLVSNSDAHSPAKLAREANLLDCPPTYPDLAAALTRRNGRFAGTLEFFPDEGKYHLDGHRKCRQRLSPSETRALGGRCPVCGGKLTVGVLSRVEELADRPHGFRPPGAADFQSLVPLAEVLSEVLGRGPATKGVLAAQEELLARLGPELHVLRQAPAEELAAVGGPVLAEAVRRMRSGQVILEGGYDGEFGVVKLFTPAERRELAGQGALWRGEAVGVARRGRPAASPPAPAGAVTDQAPPGLLTPLDPAVEGLTAEQRAAVEHRGGHLIVRAGPGSGKTRLLVARALGLVEDGADPARLCVITFTRKAAGELRDRLAAQGPAGAGVTARTFHGLGREILSEALGRAPEILDPDERAALVAALAREHGLRAAALDLALTRLKQRVDQDPPPELAPAWDAYALALAQRGVCDLDDLVRGAALALDQAPPLAAAWAARHDHILVDEYQDTNPAQVALLRLLAAGGARVAAIGDPDQAIYGFRGADRRGFASFAADFPGARHVVLTANFRNAQPVLAAAQGLMAAEPDPERPALTAMAGGGEPVTVCELASPEAEAAWVAERIVELIGGLDSRQVEAGPDGEGLAAGDVAVLYRLHQQAAPLAEALARAGVPYQVAAAQPLAETDPLDFRAQRVSLLSLHAAKGLEFPVVFIVGVEEGLLPYRPPSGEPADLAEERRLFYVGMTRARKRLLISRARRRSLFGKTGEPGRSPFLAELPPGCLRLEKPRPRRRATQMPLFRV